MICQYRVDLNGRTARQLIRIRALTTQMVCEESIYGISNRDRVCLTTDERTNEICQRIIDANYQFIIGTPDASTLSDNFNFVFTVLRLVTNYKGIKIHFVTNKTVTLDCVSVWNYEQIKTQKVIEQLRGNLVIFEHSYALSMCHDFIRELEFVCVLLPMGRIDLKFFLESAEVLWGALPVYKRQGDGYGSKLAILADLRIKQFKEGISTLYELLNLITF